MILLADRGHVTQVCGCIVEVSFIVPAFGGMSYIQLRGVQDADKKLLIDMEFRSQASDGILLYLGQKVDGTGDFVSLALKDGFVEFRLVHS